MSHGKRICKWDLIPSDDGFSYLAQFVGDTGLRVQLQEFVMGKTNESGQASNNISAEDFEIGLHDTRDPTTDEITGITVVTKYTDKGYHVQPMFEKEIQTNQQFFTEPRLAPDVTPDPDGQNEPSDFTKSVIEPKLNFEVDFRTDGKLGIQVTDYLMKDADDEYTIPVLAVTTETEGMIPKALEESYKGDLKFLDGKVRILISFDDDPVTNKASVAKVREGKGKCKMWFGKRFDAISEGPDQNLLKQVSKKKKKKKKEKEEEAPIEEETTTATTTMTTSSAPAPAPAAAPAPSAPIEKEKSAPIKKKSRASKSAPTPAPAVPGGSYLAFTHQLRK